MDMKKIFPKIFGWMFLGLLVTFLTGFYVASNQNMLANVIDYVWLIIIVEFVLVIVLSTRTHKMHFVTGVIFFLLYAFVTGLTFSAIFVVYDMASIITVFLISSFVFGLFALIGSVTKIDLSKFSSIFMMFLIAGIIVSIVNMFLGNEMVDTVICIIILIVFFGITANDIQKLKLIALEVENDNRVAIIGALDLYLDFINIFLRILNLFGKSKD